MFVRVFQGTPQHPTGLRKQWLRGEWRTLASGSGADGAVGGLASSGQWLGVLQWHTTPDPVPAAHDTLESLLADVRSFDSADVEVVLAGAPAEGAEFVQIMQARVADRAGWAAADGVALPLYAEARPDFLGSLRIWEPGGRLTVVDSFTSEAEARAGEAASPSAEAKEAYQAWFDHLSGIVWHDIRNPWRA
jgi:hypothetical protein